MAKGRSPGKMPEGPYVLVTRTLRVTSLVPVANYADVRQREQGITPTIQEVREYELDLSYADQCVEIDEAMQAFSPATDPDRMELSIRVDEASDSYAKEYYGKQGYEVK